MDEQAPKVVSGKLQGVSVTKHLRRIYLFANFMMNLKPVHGFCLKQNAVIQITSFIIHFTKLYLSFESIENR